MGMPSAPTEADGQSNLTPLPRVYYLDDGTRLAPAMDLPIDHLLKYYKGLAQNGRFT